MIQAENDANVLIVTTTVQASSEQPTVVTGEAADLLVLLWHYGMADSPLYFKRSSRNAKNCQIWDISNLKENVGDDMCKSLLFCYALQGCDTTSHLAHISRGVALKKLPTFTKQADVFSSQHLTKEEIINAGESVMVTLYNGSAVVGLHKLRYQRFSEKVHKSLPVESQRLPPLQQLLHITVSASIARFSNGKV